MNEQERAIHARRVLDAESGMTWWNRLTEIERAHRRASANSAVPADAWAAFKSEVDRNGGQEVNGT